jgi:hypothetical protein
MRVHVLTAGAVLMVMIGFGATFQIRVECVRLGDQAVAERALRAGMERRLEEGRRALTQIALSADTGQLGARAKKGTAKGLVEAVEDGIATRERQDAAKQALLREIAGAGGSGWRAGLSATALAREYRRLAQSIGKIRQAAAAVPASQAVEKQKRIADALTTARRELDAEVPPESSAIAEATRLQQDAAGRIQLLSVVMLVAGVLGMGLLGIPGRMLAGQFRREIASLEERFQFSKAKTFGILDWMETAAAVVRRVAAELGVTPESPEAPAVPVMRVAQPEREESGLSVKLADSAAQAIRALQTTAGEIGQATEQIRHIAFRTNILALNAAIEAAHAGDKGAGFGIVAAEVKNLAAEVGACTVEIDARVKALEQRIGGIAATLAQLRHSARVHEIPLVDTTPMTVVPRSLHSETQQLLRLAAEMDGMCGNPAPVLVPLVAIQKPKVQSEQQKPKVRKAAAGGRR